MTKPRPSYDEAEHDRSRKGVNNLRDFGLFETPEGPEPETDSDIRDSSIGQLLEPDYSPEITDDE